MAIQLTLEQVTIPAHSTIGYGIGRDRAGRAVTFAGDHRPMRHLFGLLLRSDEPVVVDIETYQILDVEDGPRTTEDLWS